LLPKTAPATVVPEARDAASPTWNTDAGRCDVEPAHDTPAAARRVSDRGHLMADDMMMANAT
jgi:hypothetical protein